MVEISVLNYVFDGIIWIVVGAVGYTQVKKIIEGIKEIKSHKNTDD